MPLRAWRRPGQGAKPRVEGERLGAVQLERAGGSVHVQEQVPGVLTHDARKERNGVRGQHRITELLLPGARVPGRSQLGLGMGAICAMPLARATTPSACAM